MTKFSLCLIALALIICCSHAQTAGGYTTVPPSQYNDTNIQKFLLYGFDKVYLSAVSSGELHPDYSVSDFNLTTINSIQTQVVSGMNYKYNLTFTSTDGTITIDTNYIIYNQAWTNVTSVSSLDYQVLNNTIVGGYVAVPESEYNNTTIQQLMEYGINNIISHAYASGKISYSDDNVSDFTVIHINGIFEQVVNGINYQYDLVLESNDKAYTINTTFVVYNQAWTNRTNFVSWYYIVTDNKNTTAPVDPTSVVYYTPVAPADYNNSDIQECMNFGIEDIVSQAVESKKISGNYTSSDFTVAEIKGIWEQIVEGYNYKYDLVLISKDSKITIDTEFVVFYQGWTNTTDMESSNYSVSQN